MVLDYGPLWFTWPKLWSASGHMMICTSFWSHSRRIKNCKTKKPSLFVKEQKDEGEQASAISCGFTNLLFALKNPEKEQIKITIIFTITTFIFSLCSGVPTPSVNEEYLLLT